MSITQITASRGADLSRTYIWPETEDLSAYTGTFYVYDSLGGNVLLTVTTTATGNGSQLTFADNTLALIVGEGDVAALAEATPETDAAVFFYDLFIDTGTLTTKFQGGAFVVPPTGSPPSSADPLYVTLDGDDIEVNSAIKGNKGDPGGNILAVGPFTQLNTLAIPGGTDLIRTSGYSVKGKGSALYKRLDAGSYTATAYRAQDGNGAWWEWCGDLRLLEQFGAVGNGVVDDTPALTAAAALGAGVIGFTEGYTYKLTSATTLGDSVNLYIGGTVNVAAISGPAFITSGHNHIYGKGQIIGPDGEADPTVGFEAFFAAWLTLTAYVVGNQVTQGGLSYECLVPHTSGTFATDLGAGKWVAITPLKNVLARAGIGTHNAIRVAGAGVLLEGVRIAEFNGYAVTFSTNDTIEAVGTEVRNCRIDHNGGGLQIPENAEYMKFIGNTIGWNLIGVDCIGGNNSFSNNKVDHNRVNYLFDTGSNDSHGEVTGGSANHGKLFAMVFNQITNGERVSGVSMFDGGDGGVYIRKSIGVDISSCVLGRMNVYCEGQSSNSANLGVCRIRNSLFNLHGATYTVHRNYNGATDNLYMFGNQHMEGNSHFDTTTWNPTIVNTQPFDEQGWREQDSTTAARKLVAGKPTDGFAYLGDGTKTGAIKITLPVTSLNSSQCSFDVVVYTQTSGNSLRYQIDGYAVSSGTGWTAPVVYRQGRQLAVRWGRTAAGNPVVYIGELATTWASAMVVIENFRTTRGAWDGIEDWKTGWVISQEATAFENVNQTFAGQGSLAYNPASLAAGASASTTVTVTGAALGDFVQVSFSLDLQGVLLSGYVSAADTVTVYFQNVTAGAVDLASGTIRARVLPQ